MIVLLVGFSVAALADPAPTAQPKAEKLVCRRVNDNSTGWRLESSRKVCKTAAEWRALDDDTYRAINRAKDKGMFDPDGIPRGR